MNSKRKISARQIDTVTIDEAFDHLAKSIVIQAISDYREVLHNKRIKYLSRAKYNQTELEKFFLSDWCHMLSGYDGQRLINIIKEQEHCNDTTD